jgi:hypothetical protein
MMKPRDIAVLAASVAIFLAGVASVNDSEAINVALPSQYQVIWDQSPYASPPGSRETDMAADTRPGRLAVHAPTTIRPPHDYGPFARIIRARRADRG